MVAFFSGRPDHYWIEAFATEVREFKSHTHWPTFASTHAAWW